MQKAPIAIAGALLLVVGVIMIPTAGPGFPVATIGLAILVLWTVLRIASRASGRRAEA